jgi:hypothetical protein
VLIVAWAIAAAFPAAVCSPKRLAILPSKLDTAFILSSLAFLSASAIVILAAVCSFSLVVNAC